MASRVHLEGSRRIEGLLQSVQGRRAGHPLSFSALFFGAGIWACEQMKIDGMVETYLIDDTNLFNYGCVIVFANSKMSLGFPGLCCTTGQLLSPLHKY